MSYINNHFNLALKIAQTIEHDMRFHHCAILAKKNRVISIGINRGKTNPKCKNPYGHLHAEIDCIIGVDKASLRNASLFVVRAGGINREHIYLSKPCSYCAAAITRTGIKEVYYSINDKHIGHWLVKKDIRRKLNVEPPNSN